MDVDRRLIRCAALAALLAASAAAWADTVVGYGKITAVKPTKVEDTKAQVGGALVGGVIGLISGRGHSGSNQVLRAGDGGLAGLRVGDCVAVGRGSYTNLRLVAVAQCQPKARPAPAATRDANAFTAEKREVVKAQTDADFDRTERKMRLLCVD